MAHQSLYRRYRSQKFSELRGQAHVTSALQTAVAEDRHGHAYLFSGPRGTGKTSTARILAKALNCPDVTDGEPCGVCESCHAIEQGSSFDLFELDAASHNKVDDVRDLIAKVNLGSPGRTKVYILDEVHMLSAGAENALLKTLEEPPDHVVFVLATTEPHKVVPTIRSRTQHFEFHLLPADELADHVRWVITDAGLDVDDDAVDYVLAQGGGSARDTLSALDLVAAAGGVPAGSDVGADLSRAIGASDAQAAIAAIQAGLVAGHEPRTIGEMALDVLRNTFLAAMGAPLDHLSDRAQTQAQELAAALGAATVTRALESLGQALVEMRQAPDPRVPLEVALLRLCRGPGSPNEPSQADGMSAAPDQALAQRVAALERQVAELTSRLDKGVQAAAAPASSESSAAQAPVTDRPTTPADGSAPTNGQTSAEPSQPNGPAAAARSRLAEKTNQPDRSSSSAKAPPSPRAPRAAKEPTSPELDSTELASTEPTSTEPSSPGPSSPESTNGQTEPEADSADASARPNLSSALTQASADSAFAASIEEVSQKTRARFRGGRIVGVEGSSILFGVPNAIHRDRCDEAKADLEVALQAHLGQPVAIQVIVDTDAPVPTMDPAKIETKPAPGPEADEDIGPVEELVDATDQSANGVERLAKAFPGSKVVETQPEGETP